MKLKKVMIYPNMSAKEAEDKINQKIHENADSDLELSYELLIENSVMVGNYSKTTYTLLINLEEAEEA